MKEVLQCEDLQVAWKMLWLYLHGPLGPGQPVLRQADLLQPFWYHYQKLHTLLQEIDTAHLASAVSPLSHIRSSNCNFPLSIKHCSV